MTDMDKKSKKRFSVIWTDTSGVVFYTAYSNNLLRAIGTAVSSATSDHPRTMVIVVWDNELKFHVGTAWPIAGNITTFIYEPTRVHYGSTK